MTDLQDTNWFSDETATFGDRLAAAREAQGLSQKALAHKLGVKTRTIEKWENDLAEPRANRLQMAAGLLNVSLPWLLTGEGLPPMDDVPQSDDVAELMTEMRHLRSQLGQAADQIGRLEKRLRVAISDRAA